MISESRLYYKQVKESIKPLKMVGSDIPHKIDELNEIFSDLKENISAGKTNRLRKNSSLLEICSPGSCGYSGCIESARNRELELLARINELELMVLRNGNTDNGHHTPEGVGICDTRIGLGLQSEELLREKSDEIRMMKREISRMVSMNDVLKRDNVEMEAALQGYRNDVERLKKMEEEYLRSNQAIRSLRNEVLDLKGAIRIFCRIRPNINNRPGINIRFSDEVLEVEERGKKHTFMVDRIFGAHVTQVDVYNEISMTTRSVLDGYKTCILAYGQTGSGKTYTMEGVDGDRGLIARTIADVYESIDAMKPSGWIFESTCTYVEIYNEELIDLFANERKKLSIIHCSENSSLHNCTVLSVSNAQEALECFQNAACRRKTGSTECNSRSSRSHAVYILSIKMWNEILGEKREGSVSLVDLAGSERLSISRSEGIRLKETQNINRSLAALGDVFNAISRKDNHVPFRNSKLTHLLQNFLSGNSRTVMVVNISSDAEHMNETICSLRFADKVGQCKLGSAKRQANSTVVR